MLLLYSIGGEDDVRSHAQVFEAARSLAEIYAQITGAKGLRKIRGLVLPMVGPIVTLLETVKISITLLPL